MARDNAAHEIRDRLRDPIGLVTHLGLGEKVKRQQRGVMILCPAHNENTPSCSVRVGPDGTVQVRCHGCGFSGDGFTLIACVHNLDSRRDFRRVLEIAAEFTGYDLGAARTGPIAPPPVRQPPPPPQRPPYAQLKQLWHYCLKPTLIHADRDNDALMFLVRRKLSPVTLADMDLVRIMPRGLLADDDRPWSWWPNRWHDTWRLFMRAYDVHGHLASVQARAVVDTDGPKTRWPFECSAQGLLFGNRRGILMLRREEPIDQPPLARVVIVEGMTDTMAMSEDMRGQPVAVLGVTSGSAAVLREVAWPRHVPVHIRTDLDDAGDRYADEIAASLPPSVEAQRYLEDR